jgi:hypothetical protein
VETTSFFGLLAFFLSAVAYFPYWKALLAGEARPTISSWISWGTMDVAILAGMLAQGTIAWQMVAYIVGACLIIGISVWKGATMDWKKLDAFCLTSALIAIVLWYLSGNPDVAIILGVFAFVIGTIPMLSNTWHDPIHEPILPWALFLTGGMCGVAAIPTWNIASALTPVVFLVCQVTVVVLICRKFFRNAHAQ